MKRLYEDSVRTKARSLRRSGYLYTEIASTLAITKSTAWAWVHDTPVTPVGQRIISEKQRRKQDRLIKNLAALRKQRTSITDRAIKVKALQVVHDAPLNLSHKKLLCAVMYWCEGGKDVAAGLQFINSDPSMIRTFLSLLRESFKIDESKFRAIIHLHDYHDKQLQLKFWSELSRIPVQQFYPPYMKPHTAKNIRDGYPGCISIRYHDSRLGKLIKMVYSEFGKTS